MSSSLFLFDQAIRERYSLIAGADEAGRGPLAGPVVAAAVILPRDFNSELINDSKKLSPKKREKAFFLLKKEAIDFAVTSISNIKIDEINILKAALSAMKISVEKLKKTPDLVIIDGNKSVGLNIKEKPIVQGDSKSLSIAAASIIAKYIRDKIMEKYSKDIDKVIKEFDKKFTDILNDISKELKKYKD